MLRRAFLTALVGLGIAKPLLGSKSKKTPQIVFQDGSVRAPLSYDRQVSFSSRAPKGFSFLSIDGIDISEDVRDCQLDISTELIDSPLRGDTIRFISYKPGLTTGLLRFTLWSPDGSRKFRSDKYENHSIELRPHSGKISAMNPQYCFSARLLRVDIVLSNDWSTQYVFRISNWQSCLATDNK